MFISKRPSLFPVLFFYLVLISSSLFSHDDLEIEKFPAETAHAPTPLPDRVILTWEDDPATTQSVTWRTDKTTMKGLAHLALANSCLLYTSPSPRDSV